VHFADYSSKGIFSTNTTEEDLSDYGWLLMDDPKTWEYLPKSVIENILEESNCVSPIKKVTPAFSCRSSVVNDFLAHMCEKFEEFKSDVYFSPTAFESFKEILDKLDNSNIIKVVTTEHSQEIKLEYYPEQYMRHTFRMLFEENNDDTWRLVACTHSISDTDPNLYIQRPKDEAGYFVDDYYEDDEIFNECDRKEFRFPSCTSVVYFC
jgi:hypothetical protein